MKIATWNVNSIAIRLEAVLKWIADTETDVVCLQETKCVDEKFPLEIINEFGYHAAFTGQKSYNGVAILSKHPIENVQKNFPDDTEESPKRLIIGTINGVRIVNTYIPNGTELWTDKFTFKLDWLQRLRKLFDETCDQSGDVLLCGDFNVAPDETDVWSVKFWEGKLHFQNPNAPPFTTSNNGDLPMFFANKTAICRSFRGGITAKARSRRIRDCELTTSGLRRIWRKNASAAGLIKTRELGNVRAIIRRW